MISIAMIFDVIFDFVSLG